MARFVLEIGTEEIPPRFFRPALAQLSEDGAKMLAQARLAYRELEVYGTPRRLVLTAEEMAERQASATREERGPPARVAFDGAGKPTKAAAGFARRHGVAPEDLVVRETEQGEYVFAVIEEPELPAKEALAELLPGLITGLSFPKSMRWGSGRLRFGRAVRWLLALVDAEVVEFELNGIKSGRLTRGHPTLADGTFQVQRADDYERTLQERFVSVDPARRRSAIEQQIAEIAGAERARAVDGGLLEETTFLVEWPTAACGHFDADFLRLPRVVLVEEMQHVQSYFPLENERGELLPKFIAVRDGGSDHLDTVVRGWQNVLRAKLIDVDYFYRQDVKLGLAERVEALKGVVFQERLGTMYDKTERVRGVAACAAEQAGLTAEENTALQRAALLCKADLTSAMVLEVSDLQGLMGGEYALGSGESLQVAQAVAEHYRPRFAGDGIPATKLGRLLAVSDKRDTLAACFAADIVPSGSADPYGLRREGAGVVSILVSAGEEPAREARVELSVSGLLKAALAALRQQLELERAEQDVVADVMDFLRQRLATYLREEQGLRYDLVDAALAVGIDDISGAERRAKALGLLASRAEFLVTVIACTRPINIVEGFEGGDVDPALFREEAERELWNAYREVLAEADKVGLAELFGLLNSRLRAPIDRYFDDVLVMHEDQDLRRNRLAMCWNLTQLFRRLADFSLVVQA